MYLWCNYEKLHSKRGSIRKRFFNLGHPRRLQIPCLGEDNEYVCREVTGLSDDDIADLLIAGVITTETDMPEVLRES